MKTGVSILAVLFAFSLVSSITARADQHDRSEQHARPDRHARPEQHWQDRDIRHFNEHDVHHWAGGHWYHGNHDGRLGWWWVVGAAIDSALWYSYAAPVYPYPDPYAPTTVIVPPQPATMVQQAPQAYQPSQTSVWYFCRSSGKYYPYTAACPEGWQTVPATPPAP